MMIVGSVIGVVNLICAGILAGEEFVIRYGVRKPIASLEISPHIQVRQELIYRLRILVPVIFMAAFLSGIAVTLVDGFTHGSAFHFAGLLGLISFITVTLAGTVPINAAVLDWKPVSPPENWRAMLSRWERLDTVRCWLAIFAFVCFAAARTSTI
jgi:uncharacterized membrane protein